MKRRGFLASLGASAALLVAGLKAPEVTAEEFVLSHRNSRALEMVMERNVAAAKQMADDWADYLFLGKPKSWRGLTE